MANIKNTKNIKTPASNPNPLDGEVLICFENVTNAIMAEQVLISGAFDVRVMPTPSSIRAGCGFCLRLFVQDLQRATALLVERGFDVNEVWEKSPLASTYIKRN